ncbi:glycoside hydrolase family 3 C-terminal domain-containing protein [Rothia sp. AR01]|uniref:Glycoside hydrolase family 3 C-terminal domain-containing protein n=1 Tax=Rothia santali TaxID=2949643 RepID=A0A9X2HDH7_9MICC|nr:glycoside hydrolase family 3 C-terminal domain-containing protein [Rothia santali]MCP3425697.1 glycoside hydrolase family 3 C-terminal domain-containing protein [Rothia santali]
MRSTRQLIARLRASGSESTEVEVKAALHGFPKSALETMSAFANGSGGTILFGLRDKSFLPIPGFNAQRVHDAVSNAVRSKLTPHPAVELSIEEFEGHRLVRADVEELPYFEKPCFVSHKGAYGGSYVRIGEGDHKLSEYEVSQLRENGIQPEYDRETVEGGSQEILSATSVNALLENAEYRTPSAFMGVERHVALKRLNVIAEPYKNAKPTLAGLLALGVYPQEFFPQLTITFVAVPGTSLGVLGPEGMAFTDNQSFNGGIPAMITAAVDAVRRNSHRAAVITGRGRTDVFDYPDVAVREAITNAVMHRDYSPYARGIQVQLEMYSDRLEIRSPGGLYGGIRPEELGRAAVSSSRNAALAKLLEEVRMPRTGASVCENRGSGLARMAFAMERAGKDPPQFRATPTSVTVILRRLPSVAAAGPPPPPRGPPGGRPPQPGPRRAPRHFFGPALADAVASGRVPERRLDDMATRIVAALRSVGGVGARRRPAGSPSPAVLRENAELAERVATRSAVLLRHENGVLPLDPALPRLVVVGGRAETGVLSGGGSSTVTPPDAVQEEGFSIAQLSLPKTFHRPAPLDELRRALPETEVVFLEGGPEEVRASLRAGDTAVVIAQHWATEGRDNPDLSLEDGQDELISAVAGAAGRTVVVLQTPGAVRMPWLEEVDAVLAAWYGGSGGAAAIAALLTGAASPAGRLPVSFPRDEGQLPRREMTDPQSTTSNPGEPRRGGFPLVGYDVEGADVGYRWYAREGLDPLFWFGHGLSYTSFAYEDVETGLDEDGSPRVSLTVRNAGERAGVDVPQVYLAPPEGTHRLVGWASVALEPGESRRVSIVADDARCHARFVVDDPRWVVEEGAYRLRLARSASPDDVVAEAEVQLAGRVLAP